jgi:hypothetical protein
MKNEALVKQFVNLIDVLIKDHLVLYEAKERGDQDVIDEKEYRLDSARQAIRAILDRLLDDQAL